LDRFEIEPRAGWAAKVDALGLLYHQNDDGPYWNESAYYRLTASEVDLLEDATNELHRLCLLAVQHVIEHNLFDDLKIPNQAIPWIKHSWEHQTPSIVGRFDLAFNGVDPPKMLEYNADTPTGLLEAAVVQWYWLQELFPESEQFNSLWEGLVDHWRVIRASGDLEGNLLHFASADSVEDFMTITALRDTATEAGFDTDALLMREIGWSHADRIFADVHRRHMRAVFKLYPWEWMLQDEFNVQMFQTFDKTVWMEPIWKMILSNKGILPILWQLFEGHPNLIEAYFDSPRGLKYYAEKPLLGREGANVSIVAPEGNSRNPGRYGGQRSVFQKYVELPTFHDKRTMIGSWIIGGTSHGIGIREAPQAITTNLSPFVPHLFD